MTTQEKKAQRIKYLSSIIVENIIKVYEEQNDLIWGDPNPQKILDALGEDAGDILEINNTTFLFISEFISGRQQDKLDKILSKRCKQRVVDIKKDGTAKII